MPDWLDKAKEAAKKAADEAKVLAEKAKTADYGSMIEKTKNMAQSAADEAKKAAESLSKKEESGSESTESPSIDVQPEAASTTTPEEQPTATATPGAPVAQDKSSDPDYKSCLQKLQEVEAILQDIKKKL